MRNSKQPQTHPFDIWALWNHKSAVIIKNKQPLWENTVHAYLISDQKNFALSPEVCARRLFKEKKAAFTFQQDILLNILYFAAARNQAAIKIYNTANQLLFSMPYAELHQLFPIINPLASIIAYRAKVLTLEQFGEEMKFQTVYYSPPLGDDETGKPKLFLCSAPTGNTQYFPIFLTEDHLHTFYKKYKRSNYMILTGTFEQVLSTLDANDMLRSLGVALEPIESCYAEIPPGFRVS